jgi:hypothetical protein
LKIGLYNNKYFSEKYIIYKYIISFYTILQITKIYILGYPGTIYLYYTSSLERDISYSISKYNLRSKVLEKISELLLASSGSFSRILYIPELYK